MTDEQMDLSLSRLPNRGGTYNLPSPVPPGGTFYVRWFANQGKVGSVEFKQVASGIDNLRVPPPDMTLGPDRSSSCVSSRPLTPPPVGGIIATVSGACLATGVRVPRQEVSS